MKKVDNFIGETFTTCGGGVLTVTGKEVNNWKVKYKVECSICSQDKELFSEDFLISKSHLLKGKVPCGCSKSPKWKKYQWVVKIQRRCVDLGYTFLGFDGNWIGVDTKLILYNHVTDNTWSSCNINNFINNNKGDPEVRRLAASKRMFKSDKDTIKSFWESGKFKEGTKFYRDSEDTARWTYTCSSCSYDEYVEEGLCSGVFSSTSSSLRKGSLPCRCSNNYRYPYNIINFKINRLLSSEKSTFLKWDKPYEDVNSKFHWVCNNNHPCITSASRYISGQRCRSCVVSNFGHFKGKEHYHDNLYLLISDLPYFKVGRTFDLNRRLKENQRRLDNFYGKDEFTFTQTLTFQADHITIFNLEQLLIGFGEGIYDCDRPEDTYGSSELVKNKHYEEVCSFCKDYINEWWK